MTRRLEELQRDWFGFHSDSGFHEIAVLTDGPPACKESPVGVRHLDDYNNLVGDQGFRLSMVVSV